MCRHMRAGGPHTLPLKQVPSHMCPHTSALTQVPSHMCPHTSALTQGPLHRCPQACALTHVPLHKCPCTCAGGPQMQRIWFFEFETRTWSSRTTTGGSTDWTFGHAIKRGRHMYVYGTHHPVSTEESLASVCFHMLPTNHTALGLFMVSTGLCTCTEPITQRTDSGLRRPQNC